MTKKIDLKTHAYQAIKDFVLNAVVIDDRPVLEETEDVGPMVATAADSGFGTPEELQEEDTSPREQTTSNTDVETPPAPTSAEAATENLDQQETDEEGTASESNMNLFIPALSDAFAEKEIACSFILPISGEENNDTIQKRIINASRYSDIVVIDWRLRNNEPQFTCDVLKTIADLDQKEHGRIRLICVYTGDEITPDLSKEAADQIIESGIKLTKKDDSTYIGNNYCLICLNKKDTSVNKLPSVLLDSMSVLAEGILPAFSLSAVAAIRRNAHHIAAQFSSDLDGALVANRLLTKSPEDSTELIRDLFLSECESAIDSLNTIQEKLSDQIFLRWIDAKEQPINLKKCNGKKEIDRNILLSLLKNGIINDQKIELPDGNAKFPKDKRLNISKSLYKSDKMCMEAECKFSRFVTMKREFFAGYKKPREDWHPTLTLGSLLKHTSDSGETSYYYCIIPVCDTVRLFGRKRRFPFLILQKQEKNDTVSLIITDQDEELTYLKINSNVYNILTYEFEGDSSTGMVTATECSETESFIFTTSSKEKLIWLGEVRRDRAVRDLAQLTNKWLRLGINDSEYLRLAGEQPGFFAGG